MSEAMRLIEECGELIQAVAKLERFGWDNHHPDSSINNLVELRAEWYDVLKAYGRYINSIVNPEKEKTNEG